MSQTWTKDLEKKLASERKARSKERQEIMKSFTDMSEVKTQLETDVEEEFELIFAKQQHVDAVKMSWTKSISFYRQEITATESRLQQLKESVDPFTREIERCGFWLTKLKVVMFLEEKTWMEIWMIARADVERQMEIVLLLQGDKRVTELKVTQLLQLVDLMDCITEGEDGFIVRSSAEGLQKFHADMIVKGDLLEETHAREMTNMEAHNSVTLAGNEEIRVEMVKDREVQLAKLLESISTLQEEHQNIFGIRL
jgi:hypothetical protein